MKEIKAIIREHRLDEVLRVLQGRADFPGVTVSEARGFGRSVGRAQVNQHESLYRANVPMVKLEAVIDDAAADTVVQLIETAAHTGRRGDGKIFVIDIVESVRISSGERGPGAL